MKWTDYTTKETLEDNDELMTLDADGKANKRTLMSKIWNYVVDKMTSAVVAKLTTTDKTVLGAINELNSNKVWKKFESYNIPTGNGIEINIPNNTKEIMIFVGCKNAEQVYGGKSYILKTSATIVYEKEIYSAADNLVGTGFYAVYKNNDNKLVMKCKTSNTLFAIVYIK